MLSEPHLKTIICYAPTIKELVNVVPSFSYFTYLLGYHHQVYLPLPKKLFFPFLDFSGFSFAEDTPFPLSLEATRGLLSRELDSFPVVVNEGLSILLLELENFLEEVAAGLALTTLELRGALLGQH
jgi:hypothetical protein